MYIPGRAVFMLCWAPFSLLHEAHRCCYMLALCFLFCLVWVVAVGQAASNTTIIIIACCSGGGFLALVGCIVWAKTRLNRRMKEYRAIKSKNAAVGKPLVPAEGASTIEERLLCC